MDITPYQIVVPLFCFLMVLYAWNLVYRQKKTLWEGVLWTVFWLAVAYISLFPDSLKYLSDITGIKKNENAAVLTALGILFFSVFYMLIRVEEVEQRIVKLIQDKALKDAGVGEDKSKKV